MKQAAREKREETSGPGRKLVERVGSGPWNASIWKKDGDENSEAWFVMDEDTERNGRHEFRAEEVLSLVKLAQVLARTLVFEGCVEGETRRGLIEIAEALDGVLEGKSIGQMVVNEDSPPPAERLSGS